MASGRALNVFEMAMHDGLPIKAQRFEFSGAIKKREPQNRRRQADCPFRVLTAARRFKQRDEAPAKGPPILVRHRRRTG